MQAEMAVQIEGRIGRKRQRGPQTAIVSVAVGRQRVQAVEPATQQNQDEAPVRRRGGEGGAGSEARAARAAAPVRKDRRSSMVISSEIPRSPARARPPRRLRARAPRPPASRRRRRGR